MLPKWMAMSGHFIISLGEYYTALAVLLFFNGPERTWHLFQTSVSTSRIIFLAAYNRCSALSLFVSFYVCTWRVAVTGPISLGSLAWSGELSRGDKLWGDWCSVSGCRYSQCGIYSTRYTKIDKKSPDCEGKNGTTACCISKSGVTELMPWILHERPLNKTLVRDDLYRILVNFLIYGRNVGEFPFSL